MIEKIRVCNIGTIWNETDRFKIYIHDDNILIMATAIEIYI